MTNDTPSPLEQARFNMIEQQIRPWNVTNKAVLDLLTTLKREDFVPLAQKTLAFGDFEISLGHGVAMLSPKVEARILQDLQLQGHESVLEIGTGSGYMAALLGRMAGHVTSLEIQPELAEQARRHLAHAVVANVDVKVADGSKLEQITDSYDVIVLSGSVAQVPQGLLGKLKAGGRLAVVVGSGPMMRMTIITRSLDAAASQYPQGFQVIEPWDTVTPRLTGFPENNKFVF